jgi:hypothetical protein
MCNFSLQSASCGDDGLKGISLAILFLVDPEPKEEMGCWHCQFLVEYDDVVVICNGLFLLA